MQIQNFEINREMLDHKVPDRAVLKSKEGINEDVVKLISNDKKEPAWMLQKRLQSLKLFFENSIAVANPIPLEQPVTKTIFDSDSLISRILPPLLL